MGAVDVPESVIDLLTSLRDYLQDKAEPPIYVSDRRFMKALNLLQVAAFADGREEVHNGANPPAWSRCLVMADTLLAHLSRFTVK